MKRTTILAVSMVALAVTVAHAKYDAHLRVPTPARGIPGVAVNPSGFAGQSIADLFASRAP